MAASAAQIAANRRNAEKSTGPKTPEGKERSRQNAFKHGLTGDGIVLPNEDAAEVEERLQAFRDELQPTGLVGEALVRRVLILSVRLDRSVSHETAALSERIRRAESDFIAPEGVDAATSAQLRAEARARAMFDPSHEAHLARRYEATTERGFFRALKELRQLRSESESQRTEANSPAFREALASLFHLKQKVAGFEARALEPDNLFPPPPPLRSPSIGFEPQRRPVDVPITIGRRR